MPENEPSIDPYSHVKSEYYDTETIVDPLEEGHVTCERLEETKMDYNGTTFLVSLNQQAVSNYTRFCGEDYSVLWSAN